MSMGKREREPPAGDVGDDDGLADGRESSLLSSVESAAARARLRRLRRSARTHVAHKAEHAVDLEAGAIVGVKVHRGIPVVHIGAREMLFTTGC